MLRIRVKTLYSNDQRTGTTLLQTCLQRSFVVQGRNNPIPLLWKKELFIWLAQN